MAVSDCTRTCCRCGAEFRRTAKGQSVKYCGATCQRDSERERRRRYPSYTKSRSQREFKPCAVAGCASGQESRGLCSKHYLRLLRHGDVRYNAKARRVSKPCAHCGRHMSLKPCVAKSQKYCGRRCATAANAAKQVIHATVQCPTCGGYFRQSRSGGRLTKYCSKRCAKAPIRMLTAERDALVRIGNNWKWKPSPLVAAEIDALHRIARYVERPKLKRVTCGCGKVFAAVRYLGRNGAGGNHKKLCDDCRTESERKARRIHRSKRRKALRGRRSDNIDPIAVFERDKWRCHICGDKTHKSRRGTCHPKAPELDHVVTVADGGTHTWGNVACSCRACNYAKGAHSLGQIGLPIAA